VGEPDDAKKQPGVVVWATVLIFLIGISFSSGSYFQAGNATNDGLKLLALSVDRLSAKFDLAFEVLNGRIGKFAEQIPRVDAIEKDLNAAKALGARRNDEQDIQLRELRDRSLSDHAEIARIGESVRDLISASRAGPKR
jgi:hypothetical protein